ncbi:tripartite tricarboxylate transporter substrate binding protein [Roseicella aerolata]|uniref:Tripartite tricarboxylate transporter substrate binding protein n=1 Tax=Roseicella aerolata TaxID=2883479 RepID=A0A9X1ICL8_9PROT|nr:tripartite tricarboxylate transporter substrate binding protein [Roseicella aerolata]MCB4822390.1 tripartite tricarboxylate transporter substrate binding protein [Roseicella aerolata]
MRRLLALLLLLPGLAAAQAPEPPARPARGPIRLIVPFPTGGAADGTARILAPALAASLGTPVQVENRPGGRGIAGAEAVARAAPDGRTLGLSVAAWPEAAPAAERPPREGGPALTRVALVAETPTVLLVPAGSRFQAMEVYLRAGRSWMRGLTFGSPAAGSLPHLQGEMLARAAEARLVHVAYRGTAAGLQDLANGQVDSLMAPLASAMPALLAGEVRALAVSGPAPDSRLPGVPSFASLGYPQLTATLRMWISAPPDLPPALLARLRGGAERAMAGPAVERQLLLAGLTPPARPREEPSDPRLVAELGEASRPQAGPQAN